MSVFKFRCPYCHRSFTGIDDLRGEEFDCMNCGETVLVPVKITAEPEEEPASQAEPAGKKDERAEKNCPVCSGPLDMLGECALCKARAEKLAEEKKKGAPAGKKRVRDPVMAKVMKARRPGMQKVIPSENKKEHSTDKPTRRRRRR